MSDAGLLNLLLFLPLIGAALLVPAKDDARVRAISLALMIAQLVVAAYLYVRFDAATATLQFETRIPWIADWGVYYHIGLDGMNLLLVLLTTFLGPLVVAGAFTAITKDVKLFYAMVFVIQFTMIGTLIANDSANAASRMFCVASGSCARYRSAKANDVTPVVACRLITR